MPIFEITIKLLPLKTEFEIVHLDEGRSFRLLHQKLISANHRWQYHYHPEIEIVCVPSGSGTRHVGNHLQKYLDGDIILIGPNLPHAGFGMHNEPEHEEIVIQMKEDFFSANLFYFTETSAIRKLIEKTKYGIHFFGETKKLATDRLKVLDQLSHFDALLELISILNLLANADEYELLNEDVLVNVASQKNNFRLQSIFDYVEGHYNEEISIQKIASLANLSVPAFCNYFKKKMSLTFTDFLNQYRIQIACNLLLDDKPISEISFDCGFNNVAYFNKVFKHVMKKTPTEFKKDKLNNMQSIHPFNANAGV